MGNVAYAHVVCELCPPEKEVECTRITVRGNLIPYPGPVTTKTVDLTMVKCLLNSVVSTPKAKCMCADAGNFYLMSPMERKEYM